MARTGIAFLVAKATTNALVVANATTNSVHMVRKE
jgi:hypothetical protein